MKRRNIWGKEEHRKVNINKLINKLNRVFFQSNSSRPSLIALLISLIYQLSLVVVVERQLLVLL